MRSRRSPLLPVAGAGVVAILLAGAPDGAAPQAFVDRARASLTPSVARLGERVLYRGQVVVGPATAIRWFPPDTSQALTWGTPRVRRASGFGGSVNHPRTEDTVSVEIPLQGFQPGRISIPGLRLRMGLGPTATVHRLPLTTLTIVPMMTAADSQATLKPVHGPLAAPWWERVPWLWVAGGLALIALLLLLVRRLRRREASAPPAAPSRSPAAVALEALAALRAERLPESGRMAEHAFRLGQILRRYLEATIHTTRPGHTTPELARGLAAAGLIPDHLRLLTDLLRAWDRVKFARAESTAEEAIRSESAVEVFLRSSSAPEAPSRAA